MTQDTPRVSIGMPVYNGAPLVREAIDSLLAQSFADFELIISDNASSDATQEICSAYAAADRRVRYYRAEENRGLSWNYSRVFALARGEYFKWAAHDDLCAPEFLARCVEVLERDPSIVLCYPQAVLIDEHGERLGDCRDPGTIGSPLAHQRLAVLLERLEMSNPVFGVIRTGVLARTPLVASYVASDITLLAHLALLGPFHEVPERLFLRRDHPRKADRANPTLDGVAALYDPANRGKIHVFYWRLLVAHLASIGRVPMSVPEKLRCYLYMGRWFKWRWSDLRRELRGAGRQLLRRARYAIKR